MCDGCRSRAALGDGFLIAPRAQSLRTLQPKRRAHKNLWEKPKKCFVLCLITTICWNLGMTRQESGLKGCGEKDAEMWLIRRWFLVRVSLSCIIFIITTKKPASQRAQWQNAISLFYRSWAQKRNKIRRPVFKRMAGPVKSQSEQKKTPQNDYAEFLGAWEGAKWH